MHIFNFSLTDFNFTLTLRGFRAAYICLNDSQHSNLQTMNLNLILPFLMKLALMLLMALLPLRQALAQEAQKQEHKMHVKMIRTIDGKTVLIDTTLSAASSEELARAIKGVRMDTAMLRMLDGKVRAQTLGMGESKALRGRVLEMKKDTVRFRSLGDTHYRVIMSDSLHGKVRKNVNIIRIDGNATSINGSPQLFLRGGDSLATLRIKGSKSISGLNPAEIDRIMVARIPSREKIDSLLKHEGKSYIRIMTDEHSGDHKIYRIMPDGSEVEVNGEDIGLSIARPERAIFIVRKVTVEDITDTEKAQLKATGTAVEMKAKEELKVEEISYYPNPNNGRFKLKFSLKNKGTTVVRIMDSAGTEVFVDTVEKLAGEYEREIDLSPFGRGLYFLQVAQGGRYHTKKVLVN